VEEKTVEPPEVAKAESRTELKQPESAQQQESGIAAKRLAELSGAVVSPSGTRKRSAIQAWELASLSMAAQQMSMAAKQMTEQARVAWPPALWRGWDALRARMAATPGWQLAESLEGCMALAAPFGSPQPAVTPQPESVAPPVLMRFPRE
jgi:hypothetical protein